MDYDCKALSRVPPPAAIQIQTIDMCNRACDFCPNKFGLRKTGAYMKESVYRQILDYLRDMNFGGRISPYLMNEPLIDPRLPAWIQATRRDFPKNTIFLNSNGDAIRSKSVRIKLANSGLDGMQINCYDGKDKFKEKVEIVKRWAEEDSKILVHYSGSLRRMNDRNGRLNVRVKWIPEPLLAFWNRAGHVPYLVPSGKYRGLKKCSFPFEQMYINHLGQAILCCCDYRFEVVLGSVVDTSLTCIWESQVYREVRTFHIDGDLHSLTLCRSCNRVTANR